MKKRKSLFRVKKQKKPCRYAIFKPNPSPYREPTPVCASLQAIGVSDPILFCAELSITPYRMDSDTVWLAYTDAPHADANQMLHTLLDPLLGKLEQLKAMAQAQGITYRLCLSFGEAEPPPLIILDGALCIFLLDTKAQREPNLAIL